MSFVKPALIVLGATLFGWVLGLVMFVDGLPQAADAPDPADGIVALTGGGGDRLRAGIELLQAQRGARLLISGVNPTAPLPDIVALSNGDQATFECCVDLGRLAADTPGNAAEIAVWAAEHDYSTLIVVTSDFHMPRSLIEIRRRLPDATLVPFPVSSDRTRKEGWWRRPVAVRILAIEYSKYLVVRLMD